MQVLLKIHILLMSISKKQGKLQPKDWNEVWNIISTWDIFLICNLSTEEKKTHLDTLIARKERERKHRRVIKINFTADNRILAYLHILKPNAITKKVIPVFSSLVPKNIRPGDLSKSAVGKHWQLTDIELDLLLEE